MEAKEQRTGFCSDHCRSLHRCAVWLCRSGYRFWTGLFKKASLQSTADAIALACAQRGCEHDLDADGLNQALIGPLLSDEPANYQIKVDTETACEDAQYDTCVAVHVHQSWNTAFIRMFGIQQQSITVRATATGIGNTSPTPISGAAPAILALGNGAGVKFEGGGSIGVYGNVISNGNSGIKDSGIGQVTIYGGAYAIKKKD